MVTTSIINGLIDRVVSDVIEMLNAINFDESESESKQKSYVKTYNNNIKIRSVKLSIVKPHFRPLKIPVKI